HGFAALGEAGGVGGLPVHSGLGGGFGEPGSAEGVVLEDAVPHGAPYGAGAESVEEGFGVVVGVVVGDAVVDLVAVDVVVAPAGRRGGEGLVLVEGDGRGQELEAGGGVGGGFDAVGDGAAEHLVTAADAEYGPAVCGAVAHRSVESTLPHPLEVVHSGPGAGEDGDVGGGDDVGVGGDGDGDAGFGGERVEVGGAGDAGESDGGHAQRRTCAAAVSVPARDGECVLGVEPHVVQPGEYAQHGPAGELGERGQSGTEQSCVATELVDQERGDVGLVAGIEDADGAGECGEESSADDVADDEHGKSGVAGQTHVHVVAVAQVRLGVAGRGFADDDVEAFAQFGQCGVGGACQLATPGCPLTRVEVTPGGAAEHDVTAPVAAGFEQNRVHGGFGFDARGHGLQPLRAADLGAVGADHRVVRHVLRLERGHAYTAPGEPAAHAGSHCGLPGIRRCSCDQEATMHASTVVHPIQRPRIRAVGP